MAAIPTVLRLHHARLNEREVQTIDGVRVTTPLRTLIDVIAEGVIAQELQVRQSTRRSGVVWSCDSNLRQRVSALVHVNGSTEL
jgi:hypothetical protein